MGVEASLSSSLASYPASLRPVLAELEARPYENLSKIVAYHRNGSAETAQDVVARGLDGSARGLGGTCFSLTWWLKQRLDGLGFTTAYLMADKPATHRHPVPNVHCGLLLTHEGRDTLLDPGYLLFEPLPLPRAGLSLTTFIPPHEVRIEDVPSAGVWRLHSGPRDPSGLNGPKPRFDFRKEPVSSAEFEEHWAASHAWEMMGYPVLNRVRDGVQYYLQKSNLIIRSEGGSEMRTLDARGVREAACGLFGLPPELVDEALSLLSKSR